MKTLRGFTILSEDPESVETFFKRMQETTPLNGIVLRRMQILFCASFLGHPYPVLIFLFRDFKL